MRVNIESGLNTSYCGVTTYKRVGLDRWGDEFSTLIEGDTIEKILDLVFSVCGPAGCGEMMAQNDTYIIGWQDIGPEICDLLKIKANRHDEDEEES